MKTCPKCLKQKMPEMFARQLSSKDGRHPYCKECVSSLNKVRYRERGRTSWVNDKTCSWCGVIKPRTCFSVNVRGKLNSRCGPCEEEISKRNAEGLRRCNICRKWLSTDVFYESKLRFPNIACKECSRAQVQQDSYQNRRRAKTLLKEYGITSEQYDELVAKQGGKCPICSVAFEPGKRSYPVDHVHGGKWAGRIRAIVHNDCNRFVLWTHEDSAQLRAAAELIDNPLTDWYVPGVPTNELRWSETRKKGTDE